MPRNTDPMLGDHLVDAYHAFVAESYDRLAAAWFTDLPQTATTLFRDIDGRGSLVADLAVQAGVTPAAMWELVRDLEAKGYVMVEGDAVRPAARGDEAFAAGRRALADAEAAIEQRVG